MEDLESIVVDPAQDSEAWQLLLDRASSLKPDNPLIEQLLIYGDKNDQAKCQQLFEAVLYDKCHLNYLEHLNLFGVNLKIDQTRMTSMANLKYVDLNDIQTTDMPGFLRDLLSHCPAMTDLSLVVSDVYTNRVGTQDMVLHDYFRAVGPLHKVSELRLRFNVFEGAESLVKAFPKVETIEFYVPSSESVSDMGMGKTEYVNYLKQHLPPEVTIKVHE